MNVGRPLASSPRHFDLIDQLRGVAALGVVVFHARVAFWVGWREIQAHPENFTVFSRVVAWLSVPAPFFGSLVMLFFVVSGFCVHEPQIEAEKRFQFTPYFVRRFFRIYPPYLAAVLVSVGMMAGLKNEPILESIFMVQNYTAGRQLSSNPSLWSLPVEMELYLVYPVMWWLASRWGWRVTAVVVGATTFLALAAYHAGARRLDGNFAMYWAIWCGGAWLRERWADRTLKMTPSWLTVVALFALGLGVMLTLRQVGGTSSVCWGLFFFWVVWRALVAPPRWVPRAGFFADALRGLGRWSYSLYLLHFPLLFALGAWWTSVYRGKSGSFILTLMACAAVLPFAWLFYRVIERPSHLLARRWGQRSTRRS